MKRSCLQKNTRNQTKILGNWYKQEIDKEGETVSTISKESKLNLIDKLNHDLDKADYDLSRITFNMVNRCIKTIINYYQDAMV